MSSVFLNLDFIIEEQIQAPKAAQTKFSLMKKMHFNLFIGYMATITFQLKNALLTDDCYALKMHAIYICMQAMS